MLIRLTEWLYDKPDQKIQTGRELIWLGSRLLMAGAVFLILMTITARMSGHLAGLAGMWPSWAPPTAFGAAYGGLVMWIVGYLLRRHGKRLKSQF